MKSTSTQSFILKAALSAIVLLTHSLVQAQAQAQDQENNKTNSKASNQCIKIKENKRFYERSLKAYPGLQKKECIKLPYLTKNLKPLSLTANEEYLTAFLSVHDTSKVDSEELHYIDTKEGKVIKRFKLGGVLNRNFQNQSRSFITFDNDSRVAFSIKGSFCVFNLRESELMYSNLYKAKLDGCSKVNLSGTGVKSIDELDSLTLSKNHRGFRYLWSLDTKKSKKFVYGFKLDKTKLLTSPLYKFELPKSLSKATRVSFVKSDDKTYTMAVSTDSKEPTKHLHKVVYKLDEKSKEFKVSAVKSLNKDSRSIASESASADTSTDGINYFHFVNLDNLYKNKSLN